MAKKTKKAAKAPVKEPAAVPEMHEEPAMEEKPVMEKIPEKKDSNSLLKVLAVGAIFVIALALAYYFFVMSAYSFKPGAKVDEETFKGIFADADKVYILMDVRGISDHSISNNVMQCGVDFAGSSGLAGKTVTPLSVSNDGCVIPTGPAPLGDCFSMLEDGITIYVRSGDNAVQYYSNGMVVYVGSDYVPFTCGIHRA